jgi:hypothetical protein
MKLKFILVSVAFLLFVIFSQAQQKEKLHYTTNNAIGLLCGQTGGELQVQTINGVRYKTWSAGIGIGIDYYYQRTVPVFADLRKSFFKQHAFIYADFGSSLPWIKDEVNFSPAIIKYKAAFYGDWGIGYSIPVLRKLRFTTSLGYCHKELKKSYEYQEQWTPVPGWKNFDQYHYSFNRYSLKIGLGF